FAVCSFSYEVNLFIDSTFKFTIHALQINKVTRVHKTCNHADDEFERIEIHTHQLIDVWPLNFDSNLLACRCKYGLMHLPKRSGRGSFAFYVAENLINRFSEFLFNDRDDVTEWLCGHFIL